MPTIRTVRPEVMDSVALLVLDAQDTLIDLLYNKETFLKRVAFSIEAARCLGLKIIFTEQSPEKLGRSNKDLLQLAGNPRVFPKQSFSALGAPGIDRYLRDNEIYHLLVVGLETPICIYQTGLQALEVDVEAAFLVDALGCRRQEDEAPTLEALRRLGCQVLPSETLFYSLLAEASSPYFRDFTNLVKAFGQAGFSLEQYVRRRPTQPETREPRELRQPAERESRQRDERRPGPRDGRGPRPGPLSDVTHGDERAPSQTAEQAPGERAPVRGGRSDERRPRPSDERRPSREFEEEVDEELEEEAEDGEAESRDPRSESESDSAQGNGGDPARKRSRRRRRGGRGRRSGEGQPQASQAEDAPPSGQSQTPSRGEPERQPARESLRQPQREPARQAPRPEPAIASDEETEIEWPQPRKPEASQGRPERREPDARQPEGRDAGRPRSERPQPRDAGRSRPERPPARGAPEPTQHVGAPTRDKEATAAPASTIPSEPAAPAETAAKKAASPKKAARKATKKAVKKTARKAPRPPAPDGE